MTMTVGSGPFGHRPAGRFNFNIPAEGIQYLEPFPRRIRAFARGEVVLDSVNVQMLYEQHRLPAWCFPPQDVRLDVLVDGAWIYEDGLAAGLVGIRWEAVDRWFAPDGRRPTGSTTRTPTSAAQDDWVWSRSTRTNPTLRARKRGMIRVCGERETDRRRQPRERTQRRGEGQAGVAR